MVINSFAAFVILEYLHEFQEGRNHCLEDFFTFLLRGQLNDLFYILGRLPSSRPYLPGRGSSLLLREEQEAKVP